MRGLHQTNVLEYLEPTAARLPDKVAYADETVELTFGQVHRASRAIGTALHRAGVYRKPVAVFMKKSPQTVAAFFGVAYGGCYYVPLDEEMPRFRVELILGTLDAPMMICDEKTEALARSFDFKGEIRLYSDISAGDADDQALADIRARHCDTDPLYVVFTSGSTGMPKGVVANHRSVIDYIETLSEALGFNEQTRFANQTPFYFDACLKELYPTIKFGATTYIVPRKYFMFPVKLVEFLNKYEINTVCWVVSALTIISSLGVLDKQIPKTLHTVAFGSEVFPIKQFDLWKKALPEARFVNLYGPTECTGMCCYYKVDRDFALDEVMPVGRPFRNTEILLLNEENKLAAPGEVGEICVRGASLTMGYYRAFEKTGEVFVQNPLNDLYPELIYRTGDLGRFNDRGELVFVSRKDYQVKHMGHRVELGEIEVNVNMLDGIGSACCVFDRERDRLVLYYVGTPEVPELAAALRGRLPRYLVPNAIEKLEKMPLTANGKLDRKALQARAAGNE